MLHIFDENEARRYFAQVEVKRTPIIYFGDATEIQWRFNQIFESVTVKSPEQFFECERISKYLKSIGVKYTGGYTVKLPERAKESYITSLAVQVQAALLMLWYEKCCFYFLEEYGLDPRLSSAVLKCRDVVYRDTCYVDTFFVRQFIANGVEVDFHGRHFNNIVYKDLWKELDQLNGSNGISKKLDAAIFPVDFSKEIFHPYATTLKNLAVGNECCMEDLPDVKVIVNSPDYVCKTFRKYPIYYLKYVNDEWIFSKDLSCKNPCGIEVLYDATVGADLTGVTRMITLVMNCDEWSHPREYWKKVAFVTDYYVVGGCIEICNKNDGILKFHKILQQSREVFE